MDQWIDDVESAATSWEAFGHGVGCLHDWESITGLPETTEAENIERAGLEALGRDVASGRMTE
jgi:hypothetical protein